MWDWAGIATVLGAMTVLVGAITTAALTIIRALHEATATVQANTDDRAIKATTTNVQLAAIASTVGSPVTVPQPEKLPSADPTPTPTAPVPPPTV